MIGELWKDAIKVYNIKKKEEAYDDNQLQSYNP